MATPALPAKLWVKLLNPNLSAAFAYDAAAGNDPVKISLDGCDDIDDFIKAIKKEEPNQLKVVDSGRIRIRITQDGPALRTGLKLSELCNRPAFINSDEFPLYVNVPLLAPVPSQRQTVLQSDSIHIDTEYLSRSSLLSSLIARLCVQKIVLLTSPAASGKTTLMTLLKHSSFAENKVFVRISCVSDRSGVQLLADAGIDVVQNTIKPECIGSAGTIILLDDAQAKYSESGFWERFLKEWVFSLPGVVRFVIAATHLLDGGTVSPAEFQNLPRLERKDFLLNDDEAGQFLGMPEIGLPRKMRYEDLKQLIIKDCGGLIGALRLAVDSLTEAFEKDVSPPESKLLQHFLSDTCTNRMARCFGSRHSMPIGQDFKMFLKECFLRESEGIAPDQWMNPQDQDTFLSLQKAGVLVEEPHGGILFTSHLAKRYFFKWIFPNRSRHLPSSLPELVYNVISSISAHVLKASAPPGHFPKEAVFQHLFMEGLARFTPPGCSICPELSKIFPAGQRPEAKTMPSIPGEIDFYLNGELRWGIELVVNGDRYGEHMSRFSPVGKYSPLGVYDYAVVDFRSSVSGSPTRIAGHAHRIAVFFPSGADADYSRAECLFGEDKNVMSIDLAD